MEDINYAKYILNKYIEFPNNNAKAQFYNRLKGSIKTNYVYQLTNALIIESKKDTGSLGKAGDRDTTLLDENKSLKEENQSLKEELQLKTNMYESLKSGNKHLKQQIKNTNKQYQEKISNLQSDIDKYKKQINNIKTAGLIKLVTHDDDIRIPPGQDKLLTYKNFINEGIPIFDQSDSGSDYEMDSDYGSDIENELNSGLSTS